MVVKAATAPADAVIFDLEDAVAIDDKETARILAADLVSLIKQRGIQTFVRVNSLSTGLTDADLKSSIVKGLDGVILPKTETGADVVRLCEMLNEAEKHSGVTPQSTVLIPLIETAKGIANCYEIASASSRVVAVAFGAGDYCRDLGRDISMVSEQQIELLYPRSHMVNMSRAAGIQAIDTPFLGLLTDRGGLLREVELAVRLGFKGKQCIHPSQIEPINSMFSPSEEDVRRATRIAESFEEAQARGLGAISFEGRMIDYMSYCQARDVLAKAQLIEDRKMTMTGKTSHVTVSEVFSRHLQGNHR